MGVLGAEKSVQRSISWEQKGSMRLLLLTRRYSSSWPTCGKPNIFVLPDISCSMSFLPE